MERLNVYQKGVALRQQLSVLKAIVALDSSFSRMPAWTGSESVEVNHQTE